MSVIIRIPGLDAEATAIKAVPPVERGLEALHFLNESLAKASRNYARGKPDATPYNMHSPGVPPEMFENYARCKGLNSFFQTQTMEQQTQTLFVVGSSQDTLADVDHLPIFYGTYTNNMGVRLTQSSSSITGSSGRNNSGSNAGGVVLSTGETAANVMKIISHVIPATGGSTVTDHTASVTLTASASNAIGSRIVQSNAERRLYRIGSGPAGEATPIRGYADIMLWMNYSVVLTADEIAKTVTFIRAYCASRGVTV